MEILNINIAAGETKRFEKAGGYFEILACDAAVSLFFSGPAGNRVDDAQGVVSGVFGNVRFKAFEIYSAAAQTVQLLLNDGNGGSRRQPGNVRIINKVAVACQQAFNSNFNVVDQVVALVAPAANTNGMVIRSMGLVVQTTSVGSPCSLQVFAAASAPASSTAADAALASFVLMSRLYSYSTGTTEQRFDSGSQIEIPAGWGLFVGRKNVALANASTAHVSFEVSV